MRSKEESHDYRYFPEPDLVPLNVSRELVEQIRQTLPELPEARRQRYVKEHQLTVDEAGVLAESKEMADFFDRVLMLDTDAKAAAKLLINQTAAYLKDNKLEFPDTKITPENMRDLVQASKGTINSTTVSKLLTELLERSGDVMQIIKERDLAQSNDESGLKDEVLKVIQANPKQVEEYRSGRIKVRQYFFGEVMKATKGKANPQLINKLLDELLPGQQ
jgi:aspartyl-tRNA(Asn)/glutamyl-tRNA(Gln) amidotransferase subunit B